MTCVKHWIPRPSCQTRLYHLGGLFLTPLYHGSAELAERPASMQAGLRRNDGGAGGQVFGNNGKGVVGW